MDSLIYLFVALVFISGLLASIAIWAPRRTLPRAFSVILVLLIVPLSYLTILELLSKPKPMNFELFADNIQEAEVLGVSLDEGRAIYLWLRLDGAIEPRYYILPWRQQLAEKLQSLIDDAITEDGSVKIRNPFSRDFYTELGDLNMEIVLPEVPPQKPPPPPARIFNPRNVFN